MPPAVTVSVELPLFGIAKSRHSAVKGQYTDAEGKCRVEALLFEEFGAMSAGVEELLMRVAKVAGRKLTWWQYDQTSWSAHKWMPFALQRLSVQLLMALADEAQRAIGARLRPSSGSPRRRRTPPSPRLPCVTTCLPVFVAWRCAPFLPRPVRLFQFNIKQLYDNFRFIMAAELYLAVSL